MSTLVDRIGGFLLDYRQQYPLSGNILVALGGQILYEESFGFASAEHEVPIDKDTRFGIWSITKSFTAMSVMLLAQEGKLRLDDLAADYIQGFQRKEPVTIRHLLQHRSGLPNFTSLPAYNANWNKWPLSRERSLALLQEQPSSFPPGESFAYNNTGYYLLGLIVEHVSGLSFEDFLHSRLLEPLSLRDSGIITGRRIIPRLASAYQSNGVELAPSEYIDMSAVHAAGGMYATARDLLLWDGALYTEKPLSQSVLDPILRDEEAGYGLGWFLDRKHNRRRIYHGGAYRGYRSELHRYPDDELTVIVLSNFDFVPVTWLAEQLAGIVFGEEARVPEAPPSFALSKEVFEELSGLYEGFGCQAIVERDDNGYYMEWNRRERNPMYPLSETSFRHAWHDRTYTFKPDQEGRMTFLGLKKRTSSGTSGE
ncbi:serine hydrolase domain-containing protein [Paenibacillus sp. PL2-23]|uniref:serine hydrolase domain-containing protein n=1 Tax=Paenibacillus sp. PL2-23 TaxID=2100729 RepID=UPI0030FBC661